MDRNRFVGLWAFGGVIAVSIIVMTVLVAGMWGLSKLFLDPFVEMEKGAGLIQIYRRLGSEDARAAHLKNFARSHRPLFGFANTVAAPGLCDEWLRYAGRDFDKAAAVLDPYAPTAETEDINKIIHALPETEFIRYQAYTQTGMNILRQYIAQCAP